MIHDRFCSSFVFRPVGALLAVFTIAVTGGCGARYDPLGPGMDAADPARRVSRVGAQPDSSEAEAPMPAPVVVRPPLSRTMLIGEMCPRGADGRAAVIPLFLRSTTWSVDGDDVSLPIERRTARSFSVFSWEGRRAGVFSVAGAAEVGLDRRAAIGAYAGDSPCTIPADVEGPDSEHQKPSVDATCVFAQAECGLAIAAVDSNSARPYEEDPDPLELPIAGACLAKDTLVVDIDGDGIREAYAAASFLDLARAPAEEVLAVSAAGLKCAPSFAKARVLRARNPKHFKGMDLVGVLDIDSDGRSELILAYHYSERRTWAVYTAASTVARLELVGEAIPWPVR